MRGLAVGVGVLLAAATVGATPLPSGSEVKVARPVNLLGGHVYSAVLDANVVSLTAFPGRVAPGDRFDVVDAKGLVGRVAVAHIDVTTCGGVIYQEARGTLVRATRRRDVVEPLLAVGPGLHASPRARVLGADEVRGLAGPNLQAIDIDGDGAPDLARSIDYACAPEPGASGTAICIEVWARDGERWLPVERGTVPACD